MDSRFYSLITETCDASGLQRALHGKEEKSILRGLHACVQGQPTAASRRPAEKASTLLAVAAPIAAPRQAWTPGPELLPTITRALYGAPSAAAAPIVCGPPTGTTSPAYSTSKRRKERETPTPLRGDSLCDQKQHV